MPHVPVAQDAFIPLPVLREVAIMAGETGVKPVITFEGTAAVRLTHTSGRLRIETVFRPSSNGWKRNAYQFFRDGERMPMPKSWEAYRALRERLPPDASGLAVLPALTPLSAGEPLPLQIRQSLSQCEMRLGGRDDVAVSVGRDGKGRYVLAIAGTKATMHMTFETLVRSGRKCAVLASTDPIRVITAEGADLTEEVQGKLNKALARILPDPPGAASPEADPGRPQGAQAGGPSDRTGTVMRC
nr:hypothetical protein [Streptomyces scabiei]